MINAFNFFNMNMHNNTNNFNGPNHQKQRKINIIDYFEMNKKMYISPDMYCSQKCFVNSKTEVTDNYFLFPNVLVLFLNYGKDIKFDCKVEFSEIIDLSNYSLAEKTPKVFKLLGLITHLGVSGDSGHYIAYCRHFDGSFCCFNDKNVTTVKFNECKKNENLNYVLFYEKM